MAYDREQIRKELIRNIKRDENITSFQDAALTIAPDISTLYTWEFEKLDDIKSAIAQNKIKVKSQLRKQWKDAGASATLQLALYKLLATEDERKALAMEYHDHTTAGEALIMPKFVMDETNREKPD